ncbi:hypothetical protein VTN00DRAFT_7637 [Thermoascus crustaceus]|uniref:uncharacterized protein n=1 Tax=Thermoascus crustaceus TaxID=5088 RepID=UPI003742089B
MAVAAPNMNMDMDMDMNMNMGASKAMKDLPNEREIVAQAIIYAMQNDCNMFNCAAVIASAGCTALGMVNQDPNAVLGCMTGGAQAACPCMNCIASMGDFLKSHGICPT